MQRKTRLIVFCLVGCFSAVLPLRAAGYNTLAVDVPFGGGAMLTYSRFWRLTRYIDAGWVLSGGQINRDEDIKLIDGTTLNLRTTAWVAPLTGPVLSLHNNWIGISVGYAAFYANTDVTMHNDQLGTLKGKKRAWGTGLYSPLLVLDIYDKKHDLIYGVGLGGYFGTSYPNLEASNQNVTVRTDESPIDTLTFHIRCLWGDHRSPEPAAASSTSDF